ncbi:hypothetical protein BG015_001860 [Linnemannia schmuckeri]|uniref:DUF221-domain-containing protein n=1 Tax=Linnemannia schmuckeri TaxID=64567 RepID=A0A9P5S6X3_9FUNG|nr:hypothetical protein BG015_001860 [Linnemannia schmuckeri]
MDPPQSAFWVQSPFGHDETIDTFGRGPDGKPKATNTTGLTGQIIISVAIGLVGFFTFCVLRTRWIVMFAPRTKLRRHTPPILSATFFGWIPQLLRIPEGEMLDIVGLDAVMLLRFFAMAIKLFACCLIPGMLIIWPINYYSTKDGRDPSQPDDDDEASPIFSRVTPTEGVQGTSMLYLFTQFTFTWVFSLLTLFTIWKSYEGYVSIRRKFILQRAKTITNRTVMVVGLPNHLQNDRALATFYESLGAGNVESAHVVRHVRTLKRLIEQREHALKQLERAYTRYYGNPSKFRGYDPDKILADNERALTETVEGDGAETTESSSLLRPAPSGKKRPTTRLGLWGLFGKKVDKIDHCREVFATLDKAVQKMRMSRIFATTAVGFVTFEEMHSAQILAQTVNTQETLTCETSTAPEPRDVYWDNLILPPSELTIRSVVVNTTVFFLIFFWAGPIAVFSSFLNLETLEKLIPGITIIAETSPAIKSVLQGFLPTAGVSIFLAVVPNILEALCKSQGIQSHSGIGRSLYNKYFTFILFNVVLVFTVAGTWAQTFNKVYHNLGELTLLLATSLSRVAPFFVNFLILKGIGMYPVQLLLIGDVFKQSFHGFLSKTPRDYAETRAPPEQNIGVVYSNATLAFVIVLIYSCIKPIILPFGLLYFTLGYVVYKYQVLYVFFRPNESNGKIWPMVYNRIMVGLLIFQSTMLGVLLLKKSYLFGALLVPLPIGTVWFWVWTTKAYKLTAEYVPLELLRPDGPDTHLVSTSPVPAVLPSAIGAADQVPGHVLIDVGQPTDTSSATTNGVAATNGQTNGIAVATATAVITPGGSQRLIPRSAVEDDDYQAIPDRYTDYRQPPMTLYPGVLNSGMRQYINPAISGPLPTLWLPLKKSSTGDGKKPNRDEESQIGDGHDSDSDDEHHIHDHVESALQRPPFKLPTKASDEPQSYEEGDNLVGGGQDEPISAQNGSSSTAAATKSATTPAPTPSCGPQTVSKAVSEPAPTVAAVRAGTAAASNSVIPDTTAAAGTEDSSATPAPAKPNPAIDGLNEVYYHHPERAPSDATTVDATPPTESSTTTAPRVRTVQGQGSRTDLLQQQQANASGTGSTGPSA